MTEWHIRYGGPRVMIYWHVEKKSVCIYSQLKSCSSSEVAAMIEGLLRHLTSAYIHRNYVDTHSTSVVGFASTYLLAFGLLTRLKKIGRIRLHQAHRIVANDILVHTNGATGNPLADGREYEKNGKPKYPYLELILTRPIRWHLIEHQYDQIVKYATALRLGTAESEQVLRRFTRGGPQTPHLRSPRRVRPDGSCSTWTPDWTLPPLKTKKSRSSSEDLYNIDCSTKSGLSDRPGGAQMEQTKIISRDPGVMSGELVFSGTRVEVKTLIDYLKAGHSLNDFLQGFPTVSREQAEAYLEMTLRDAGEKAPTAVSR